MQVDNDPEESKDPKVKASEILQSVFGPDAEDAVSLDGALSEGDAISIENEEDGEFAFSIIEKDGVIDSPVSDGDEEHEVDSVGKNSKEEDP